MARLKPIRQWNQNQVDAAIIVIDCIHDYGDPKRSTPEAIHWFFNQPIPAILYDTYEVNPVVKTTQQYASDFLGFDVRAGSAVEEKLLYVLKQQVPERLGIQMTGVAQTNLIDFGIIPSGCMFQLTMEQIQNVMKQSNDVKGRFIKICSALKLIRVDDSSYDRDTKLVGENKQAISQFFKSILAGELTAVEGEFFTNNDGTPSIWKYLDGFTQKYHALNALDSAGSSLYSNPTGGLATYEPVNDYAYSQYLMMLPRKGEEGNLFDVTINNSESTESHPLQIRVKGRGYDLPTDTIPGTFNPKTYTSGPTLPYISRLIASIYGYSGTQLKQDLPRLIKTALGESKIFTLEAFLMNIPVNEQYKDTLLRFLCDWKGFGDAEQTKKNIDIAYQGGNLLDRQPGQRLLDCTKDEIAWVVKRLKGLSCGYDHGRFLDFSFNPAKALTEGEKAYGRFIQLTSRVNQIIGLSRTFADEVVIRELKDTINAGIAFIPTHKKQVLQSFNIKVATQKKLDTDDYFKEIVNFSNNILISKLRDAFAFFEDVSAVKSGFSDMPTYVLTLNPEDVTGDVSKVMIGDLPILTFCDKLDVELNNRKELVIRSETILKKLPPALIVNNGIPVPVYQTQILSGELLKQNNTIGLEFGDFKTLVVMLEDADQMWVNPEIGLKKLNTFTGSLSNILNTFYSRKELPITSFYKRVESKIRELFDRYKANKPERQNILTIKKQFTDELQTYIKSELATLLLPSVGAHRKTRKQGVRSKTRKHAMKGGNHDTIRAFLTLGKELFQFYKPYSTYLEKIELHSVDTIYDISSFLKPTTSISEDGIDLDLKYDRINKPREYQDWLRSVKAPVILPPAVAPAVAPSKKRGREEEVSYSKLRRVDYDHSSVIMVGAGGQRVEEENRIIDARNSSVGGVYSGPIANKND